MNKNYKKIPDGLKSLFAKIDNILNFNFTYQKMFLEEFSIDSSAFDINTKNQSITFTVDGLNDFHKPEQTHIDVNIDRKYFLPDALLVYDTSSREYTLKYSNIAYKRTDENTYNVAILNKPEQLKKVSDYIIDNSNISVAEFDLLDQHFLLMVWSEKIFIISDNKIKENEFFKYVRGIKLAIGFLTCDFIGGDEIYLLRNDDEELVNFKKYSMTKEQGLKFNIFTTCMPVLFPYSENEASRALSSKQFSYLCELIINNIQLETAINYIAQSANLWTEQKLTFLAIALEALTGYVSSKNDEKLLPDKEFDKIKEQYKIFLKNFNLDDDVLKILEGKFNNKKSNRNKLKQPFVQYNIALDDKDAKMIDKRNSLLHGNGIKYSENILEDALEYEKQAMIYYHLLYSLILKICGFNGIIINLKLWDEIVAKHNNRITADINYDKFVLNI